MFAEVSKPTRSEIKAKKERQRVYNQLLNGFDKTLNSPSKGVKNNCKSVLTGMSK